MICRLGNIFQNGRLSKTRLAYCEVSHKSFHIHVYWNWWVKQDWRKPCMIDESPKVIHTNDWQPRLLVKTNKSGRVLLHSPGITILSKKNKKTNNIKLSKWAFLFKYNKKQNKFKYKVNVHCNFKSKAAMLPMAFLELGQTIIDTHLSIHNFIMAQAISWNAKKIIPSLNWSISNG